MLDSNTVQGVILGLVPGIAGAFVVYLRSLSRRNDAESALLRALIQDNTERLNHIENGGGTAKVKQVLAEVGAVTKDGIFGRRTEPVNPEQLPPPDLPEHTAELIRAVMEKAGNKTHE